MCMYTCERREKDREGGGTRREEQPCYNREAKCVQSLTLSFIKEFDSIHKRMFCKSGKTLKTKRKSNKTQ